MTRRLPSVGRPEGQPSATSSLPHQQLAGAALTPTSTSNSTTISRTFVITGANRGIGLGLAKALSKNGHVIGTARNPSSANELKAIPNVTVLALDVSSTESIANFAKELAKLAPHGIDVLWNNAGMSAVKFNVTDETIDDKTWLQQLAVNSVGPTLVTNAVLPLLRKENKKGTGHDRKVVFTSSICGSVTSTSGKGTGCAYFSSKAALNSTVKFWHASLAGEGFNVVPIHPGWVRTDMGGPDGAISVEESVMGMLKVLSKLNAESELKLRVWDGSVLPW